jgi:heme exporter protein B
VSSLGAFLSLVRWECVRELRRGETVVGMVLFALVSLFVLSFAIDPSSETAVRAQPGILWTVLLLAGTIGIERSFGRAGEERVLEGLLLSPVGRTTIYYARLASTWIFVAAMELLVLAAFVVLYNVRADLAQFATILFAAWAGALGFVAAGITLAAMTRSIQGGEVLLRLLLLPLLIPFFQGVVSLTGQALRQEEIGVREIGIIAAFDLIYVAAGQLLFERVVADFEG